MRSEAWSWWAVTGQLVFRRVELVSVSVAVGTIRREILED